MSTDPYCALFADLGEASGCRGPEGGDWQRRAGLVRVGDWTVSLLHLERVDTPGPLAVIGSLATFWIKGAMNLEIASPTRVR